MEMITTWKGIAKALDVSVSTAKRWFYQSNMPVYKDQRNVWADYDELKEWRKGK